MELQIKNWGNGQGLHIPKSLMKEAGLQLNDYLLVQVNADEIILRKTFRHKTLKERAEAYGGELHLSDELDWGEPEGSEVL